MFKFSNWKIKFVWAPLLLVISHFLQWNVNIWPQTQFEFGQKMPILWSFPSKENVDISDHAYCHSISLCRVLKGALKSSGVWETWNWKHMIFCLLGWKNCPNQPLLNKLSQVFGECWFLKQPLGSLKKWFFNADVVC